MPTAANITVKKADGTTDIVYSLLTASGGDNSPAVWLGQAGGAAVAHQPTLTLTSKWNGPKTARRVEGTFKLPYVITGTDSIPRIAQTFVGSFAFVVPAEMASTSLNEAAAQLGNLLASSLIKSCVSGGYAPT